ncbi:hypothetical protein FNB79_16725 [Formosa sediminum]|uniref:DUF5683 domain-containing protein n=1 Tax=Formosa sediminum TaxID=2594004 RepID=A0A516GVJ8_9FLAO|nr:DUF5683 domain-containing protein [Formosa sediminum]QDO95544.1 hypothetical protein FNB79_16725 [Formosa sediminum]
MQSKFFITTLLSFLFCLNSLAQDDGKSKSVTPNKSTDTLVVDNAKIIVTEEANAVTTNDTLANNISKKESRLTDPLAPARAAFYSAILPGLGQAYNRKYWKIPIVYAAIGTGVYFYIDNNNAYNRYRDAYKRRLAGFTDDEFYGRISDDGLINAQEQLRENKELSLLVTIGLYVLNIVDANVDAHLLQFNIDDNLSLAPHFNYNEVERSTNLGFSFNFKF